MADFIIKENTKGYYVDFTFRKQINGQIMKEYKRVYLDSDLSKSKQQRQANILYMEFLNDCEDKIKLNGFNANINDSMTLSDFIDNVYLDYIKNNLSLSYYYENVDISKIVKSKIGHYKLKELSPIIIQQFYDFLAKDYKRHIVEYYANEKFAERTKKLLSISGRKLRKKYSSHPKYYTLAIKGKKVAKDWCDFFTNYLDVPFEYLFKKVEYVEDYSYCSKKKPMTFLKSCLSEAKKKLLIKENYAKSEYTSFLKDPNPNKEKDILSEEEFFKLYNYITNMTISKQKAFFMLMLNTGARKEEVLGIKWETIDFKEKMLTFSTTVIRVNHKGKVVNENKTKNASSNRRIPLSDETIKVLIEYKIFYQEKYSSLNKDDFLFRNDNKKDVLSPDATNRWLNKILNEIGLRHVTVHSLRHSYASLMINYMPIANVSKRIGHSQISTTLNIYSHQINGQNRLDDLKNIINNDKTAEIISALDLLKKVNLLTAEEYKNKKNIIENKSLNFE